MYSILANSIPFEARFFFSIHLAGEFEDRSLWTCVLCARRRAMASASALMSLYGINRIFPHTQTSTHPSQAQIRSNPPKIFGQLFVQFACTMYSWYKVVSLFMHWMTEYILNAVYNYSSCICDINKWFNIIYGKCICVFKYTLTLCFSVWLKRSERLWRRWRHNQRERFVRNNSTDLMACILRKYVAHAHSVDSWRLISIKASHSQESLAI